MLKLSTFPFKTLKTQPKVSDNRSTSLLLQGSYIRQAMAGAYEFLPMGYRVLANIEKIIHEELDKAGWHEMLMTILTPREIWETTGRWDIPEYFKVPGWGNTEYRIAPTNEENVTNIMTEFIQSYKDLPTCVYHTQKKFRNEKRAKSGLLRGREFIMNDAYSFHASVEDFDNFYAEVKKIYLRTLMAGQFLTKIPTNFRLFCQLVKISSCEILLDIATISSSRAELRTKKISPTRRKKCNI